MHVCTKCSKCDSTKLYGWHDSWRLRRNAMKKERVKDTKWIKSENMSSEMLSLVLSSSWSFPVGHFLGSLQISSAYLQQQIRIIHDGILTHSYCVMSTHIIADYSARWIVYGCAFTWPISSPKLNFLDFKIIRFWEIREGTGSLDREHR